MLVDHPNIIRLYETYEDELFLHLVMELCEGGDVCDRIIEKKNFSEVEAAYIMKQLLIAIKYLHSISIIHRDLKGENFLYINAQSDEIKICDFGMSIKNIKNKMKSVAGTPYYLAPEILKGSYTKAVDVWSLGVFMYLMLIGKYPFKGSSLESIYEKAEGGSDGIFKLQTMNKISDLAQDLIQKMLTVSTKKRITVDDALNHPWISNFIENTYVIPNSVFESLTKYKAKNKLWREAIKIVVKNLSDSQISTLSVAFKALDTSNTGFISTQELQDSMKAHGFILASDEIQTIMENCSYINNGKINYTDFLVATLDKKYLMDEEIMWGAFKIFDTRNSGKINCKDLKEALRSAGCECTPEEFQELVAGAKLNSNSELDFENFKTIMSCFEEENEILSTCTQKMTLSKIMSIDFKLTKSFTNGKNTKF
jgi:calcium-dependent protein kinase